MLLCPFGGRDGKGFGTVASVDSSLPAATILRLPPEPCELGRSVAEDECERGCDNGCDGFDGFDECDDDCDDDAVRFLDPSGRKSASDMFWCLDLVGFDDIMTKRVDTQNTL